VIVIKVELHSARTGKISQLGKMHISNDGTVLNQTRGNYNVEVLRKGSDRVARRGKVYDFPKASYNIWRLVFRALRSAFPEEERSLGETRAPIEHS
jgi:hypothetical protein